MAKTDFQSVHDSFRNLDIKSETDQVALDPIVFCGPSGSGKTTLVNMLIAEFPEKFKASVSYTTRALREGEVNGRHYHFVSKERFEELMNQEPPFFIETAKYGDNWYGTSIESINDIQGAGMTCLLILEVQGLLSLEHAARVGDLNFLPRYVNVKCRSIFELYNRLVARGTESREAIEVRCDAAYEEMQWMNRYKHLFDKILINNDLIDCYAELKEWVFETQHK